MKALEIRKAPGNLVDFADTSASKGLVNLAHELTGQGNQIVVEAASTFSGTLEIQGSDNIVRIGKHCSIRGKIVVKGRNQRVTIGDHTTFVGVYLLCIEECNIEIGSHCMFSRDIEIRTSDAHSVVDRASGRRINLPGSVRVGTHVWIGVGALVSKGASVPDDSIVGAHSFVNGTFDEQGIILAGAPARIVKRGITWNRSRKKAFTERELDHWRPGRADGPSDAAT